jgi:hypothetical protein
MRLNQLRYRMFWVSIYDLFSDNHDLVIPCLPVCKYILFNQWG